jgi:hypothetical protein
MRNTADALPRPDINASAIMPRLGLLYSAVQRLKGDEQVFFLL